MEYNYTTVNMTNGSGSTIRHTMLAMASENRSSGSFVKAKPRIKGVRVAANKFAPFYDTHMRETGHYDAMTSFLTEFRQYINFPFIEIGCGTGEMIAHVIKGFTINDIAVRILNKKAKAEIVGIDISAKMLEFAKPKIRTAIKSHNLNKIIDLRLRLKSHAMYAAKPEKRDFFETVLCSYIAHWLTNKEDSVAQIASLMRIGGRLISIEEHPLHTTPTESLPKEVADAIRRHVKPINPKDYFDYLRANGLHFVAESKRDILIGTPNQHTIYGLVFEKHGTVRTVVDLATNMRPSNASENIADGIDGTTSSGESAGYAAKIPLLAVLPPTQE